MSGDRGGFTPKGFINLREAIEVIGKATVPDWTGAEQNPENWELFDGQRFRKERRHRFWLKVMENAKAFYGDVFKRAAEDYWHDSGDHPGDAADRESMIPIYEEQIRKISRGAPDRPTVVMLHAARRIYFDADYPRRNAQRAADGLNPYRPKFHCSPPTIEGDDCLEVIPLDGSGLENLEKLEEGVDVFLREREVERSLCRERAERVWDKLGPELHANTYPCVVLNYDGEEVTVPPKEWAGPVAEILLRDCKFGARDIFVGKAVLSLAAPMGGWRGGPGRRNKGVVAAEVYLRVFSDGHEQHGYTWSSAIAELENHGAPKVSKRTLRRGLETLRQKEI